MNIIGVDFSGAQSEGKTWVTEGHIPTVGCLVIDRIQPMFRNDLSALLEQAPLPTVVALDFPFSLPRVFLEWLDIPANTMKQVWRQMSGMSLKEYSNQCRTYGRHPMRTVDQHYAPVAMSALNTRLVPMTYYGTRMLNDLDRTHRNRWWVPPLDFGEVPQDRITLLEVMPGAFLWSIGFDRATVKSYKTAKGWLMVRNRIINQLGEHARNAGIEIPNLLDYRRGLRVNDDCLDSAVAALAAASWATHQDLFLHPQQEEYDAAIREGWLYGLAPEPQP